MYSLKQGLLSFISWWHCVWEIFTWGWEYRLKKKTRYTSQEYTDNKSKKNFKKSLVNLQF